MPGTILRVAVATGELNAQEAFIKAYRALPQFRGDSAFYTWLYRIAINTAKNWLAGQGRRAPTSTLADVEEAETFDEATPLREVDTPDSMLLSKDAIADVIEAELQERIAGVVRAGGAPSGRRC